MTECQHLDEYKDYANGRISEKVEKLGDGYAINGCCGGGCYVIHGIKFCPFCGEKLE